MASGCSIRATGTWTAKTTDQTTQAIGALAIAPSNDSIIYAGTGEGALSGDSYFGSGVLKSTDGGNTWTHVSDDYFRGVATSRIVVDPTNADHLFAAIVRGRGGARRTSPKEHSRFGVWESQDGGASWKLIQKSPKDSLGATDLEMDPLNPQILYSSFLGDAIYKSTNGGKKWTTVMTGLPNGDYEANQTRFSITISHPSATSDAVLYAGFDWIDAATGKYQKPRVFKSTNAAASWTMLPAGSGVDIVEDYCATQCSYDNVIEADPTNPNVVFAAGQFDYNITHAGGIYRSDDGGATWRNLGYDMHPDFHALAFDPANTQRVLVGNDGGVWTSDNQGGRQTAGSPAQQQDVDEPERQGSVDRTVHVDRDRSAGRAGPGRHAHLGRHAGQRHGAEVREQQYVVRRGRRRRRPGGRRPDVRVVHPRPVVLRLQHVLLTAGFGVPVDGRRQLLHGLVHPQGPGPDRPLRLLRAVRHEPVEPEPAVHRDVPPVPHGQRQDAGSKRRPVEQHQR